MPVSAVAEHEPGHNAPKTGKRAHDEWTAEDDGLLHEAVIRFGCKWRQIATALPGRSDSYATERSNP